MAFTFPRKIDFAALNAGVREQFRNLDPKDTSTWPAFPRYTLALAVMLVVVVVLWFAWLDGYDSELESGRTKEQSLRDDYKKKLAQAVNLDVLKKQREQVQQYVTQLEKQLPSKAEMEDLLSDITQAGLGRSLQFELFRPGQVVVREYYAELPITLRVSGRFHDIGAFTSDIANLSRIVTLNNLTIAPTKEGVMSLEATVKTFRYLDASEIAVQRKSATVSKPAAADGVKK